MHTITLNRVLARIAAGTHTSRDVAALRAFLCRQPQFAACLRGESQAPRAPDDDDVITYRNAVYSRRIGADAVVSVTCSWDRTNRGEVLVQTVYTLTDGSRDPDVIHRIHIAWQPSYFIRDLWDMLFDEVCAVCHSDIGDVAIRLDLPELPGGAHHYVRAIAEIVAAELRVIVTGTAPRLPV